MFVLNPFPRLVLRIFNNSTARGGKLSRVIEPSSHLLANVQRHPLNRSLESVGVGRLNQQKKPNSALETKTALFHFNSLSIRQHQVH